MQSVRAVILASIPIPGAAYGFFPAKPYVENKAVLLRQFLKFIFKRDNPVLFRQIVSLKMSNLFLKFQIFRLQCDDIILEFRLRGLEC